MVALPLVAHFLDSSRRLLGVSTLSPAEVERRLESLVADGRAAHPELDLDARALVAALAGQVADGTEIADALSRIFAGDFFLATACNLAVPSAIERLEAQMIRGRVDAAVARIDDSPGFVDRVLRRLRDRLFGDGRRIADYTGREPLAAWIRAAALRIALQERASVQPSYDIVEDEGPIELIDGDAVLEHLHARDPETVEAALDRAFVELGPRERAALRLRFFDGLEVGQIGRIYQVHRATVSRWISQTRDRVRRLAVEACESAEIRRA